MGNEAEIIINGEKLSLSEAMALRVAVSAAIMNYSDPDFLGSDDHGRAMTQHYKRALGNIQTCIFKNILEKN